MIGVGDTVTHLADRTAEYVIRGSVLSQQRMDGAEQSLVQWSNELEPIWSPTANLIKI